MCSRTLTAASAVALLTLTQWSAAADATLTDAARRDLPSVVLVVVDVTGSLTVGGQMTTELETVQLGSGFFISDDGLVVTAAHVAAPDDRELRTALVDALIRKRTACASDDACNAAIGRSEGDILAHTTDVAAQVSVSVITQASAQLTTDPGAGLPARLLAASAPTDTDLAVVRVNGSGFPALGLAPSDSAPIATPIAVIGYPATETDGVSTETAVAPTVTTGVISARRAGDRTGREVASNAELVQTDAVVEHGDSGGPAIDAGGDVVGVVSYGPTATTNFLVAAGEVQRLLSAHSEHAQQGRVDALWRGGLADYDAGRFAHAATELGACAAISAVPDACQKYKDLAEQASTATAAASAASPSPHTSAAVPLILALLGTVTIIWTVRRRPRSGRPRHATPPWTMPPDAYDGTRSAPTRGRSHHVATVPDATIAAGQLVTARARPARTAGASSGRSGSCPMCGAKGSASTCMICGFSAEQ
jgi:S1-C subfamily serine protease